MARDVNVSPFVAAMQQRGRPSRTVAIPGTTAKVALRVPTANERAQADAAARVYLTQSLKLDALQLSLAAENPTFKRQEMIELLALVMREPADPSQAYAESADQLRDDDHGLTDEDLDFFRLAIADFTRERYEPELPDDDAALAEVILGLKADGALSAYVESCDGAFAKRIALSLVRAWPTPTPRNSSAT